MSEDEKINDCQNLFAEIEKMKSDTFKADVFIDENKVFRAAVWMNYDMLVAATMFSDVVVFDTTYDNRNTKLGFLFVTC